MSPLEPHKRPLSGFDQQLDLDGHAHDLAPATERLKLFEPAPIQLAGQQDLLEQIERRD